jgi:hypothetical protein
MHGSSRHSLKDALVGSGFPFKELSRLVLRNCSTR